MILKNNLNIQEAKNSDIPYLVALLKELFSIEKDFTFDKVKHEKGLNLLFNDSNALVLIARFEEEVVAMVTMQTIISTAIGEKAGLIEDFVVKDDFKNLGIGTHLFEYLKAYCKQHEIHRMQLVCDNDNENAKEFYTKKAFTKSNLSAWYHLME